MQCSACSELLVRSRLSGVEFDRCRSCGGIWVDKQTLKQLAQDPQRLRDADALFTPTMQPGANPPRSRHCPVCRQPLAPFEYDAFRGVRLDGCQGCGGVWLDHGEAKAIAAIVEPNAPAADPDSPAPTEATSLPQAEDESGLELAVGPRPLRAPEPAQPEGEPPIWQAEPAGPDVSGFPAHRSEAGQSLASSETRWSGRLPLVVVGSAILLAVLGIWWWKPEKLARVPLTSAVPGSSVRDPCLGRKRCVIVVVAPWCPGCKSAVPVVNELQRRFEKMPSIAMKVVIASDSESNLKQMATQFKVPVFFDPNGSLQNAMGNRGVPQWYVIDDSGSVLKKMTGVYLSAEEQLLALGLEEG